jgi:hypothetical protein
MVVMNGRYGTLARAGGVAALTLGALFASQSADARVVVGFGFGLPLFFAPPVVYAPPPAYYAPPPPPPVVYAPPPPAYYAPPTAAPAAASGQQCREYQSTAMINGQPQQTVGTACLQPDGTWRIVR